MKVRNVSMTKKMAFSEGDFVVYPTHGVGRVTGVEVQSMGDLDIEVFAVRLFLDDLNGRALTVAADEFRRTHDFAFHPFHELVDFSNASCAAG